jgi:sugar lactone lactonase YvrE
MIRGPFAPLGLMLLVACGQKEAARPADASAPPDTAAVKVATTEGFSTPESVLWDAATGVWFVSNINGNPADHDGNGFISRVTGAGVIDSLHFVAGGRNGVTLNGPKGMALVGDTLWVADIDAVRGFDRNTGAAVATVEFGSRARFLNDVVAASDGTLYITDTGVAFDAKGVSHPGPDRIFAVKGRTVSVAAEGGWLSGPNGIAWDAGAGRYLVVPFLGQSILGWAPGGAKADTVGTGPGSQDGVVFLDGHALISSWADSTVFTVAAGTRRVWIRGVNSPADIGLDPARRLVAVPLFTENKVEFWRMPALH